MTTAIFTWIGLVLVGFAGVLSIARLSAQKAVAKDQLERERHVSTVILERAQDAAQTAAKPYAGLDATLDRLRDPAERS